MTLGKNVKFFGTAALAMMLAAPVLARDRQRQAEASASRETQSHTNTTKRQRTENGRARSDTWIRADGKTTSADSVRTRNADGFTRPTTHEPAGRDRDTGFDSVTRRRSARGHA